MHSVIIINIHIHKELWNINCIIASNIIKGDYKKAIRTFLLILYIVVKIGIKLNI
jgi:hypothetical protein